VCHFGWQLSFQGEPGSAIVLPKCGPGEYITSDGKQLTCVKFGMLCNTCMRSGLPVYFLMVTMLFRRLVILQIRSGDKNNLEVIFRSAKHARHNICSLNACITQEA